MKKKKPTISLLFCLFDLKKPLDWPHVTAVLHGEVWTSLVAADIAAKLWSNGGTLKFNSKIKPQATWGTAKPEHLIVLTP